MKMTLREAADFVNRDKSTLFRAIKQGELPYTTNDANLIFVEQDDLQRLYPPITQENQLEIKKRGRPAGRKSDSSPIQIRSMPAPAFTEKPFDSDALIGRIETQFDSLHTRLETYRQNDLLLQQKIIMLEQQCGQMNQACTHLTQKITILEQKLQQNHQEILHHLEKSFTQQTKHVKKWWQSLFA